MRVRAKLTRSLTHRIAAVFGAALLLAGSIAPIIGAHTVSADATTQDTAKVSFTFDDGLSSALLAAQTLQPYHYAGTDYIITNCVGLKAPVPPATDNGCAADGTKDYMSWDDIHTLQSTYGWEIGSHTETHPLLGSDTAGATPLTDQQLDNELAGSQQALADQGFNATDFASPYGDYDNRALAVMAKYYASHRTFQDLSYTSKNNKATAATGTNTFPYYSPYSSYPYNNYLLTVMEVQGNVSVAAVEDAVDQAAASHQWLILVFHNIMDGNASTAEDDYQYNASDLGTIAAYVQSKNVPVTDVHDGLASGTNVMTDSSFNNAIGSCVTGGTCSNPADYTGWVTDSPTTITNDQQATAFAGHGSYDGTPQGPLNSVAITSSTAQTHLFSPEIPVVSGTTYTLTNFVNVTSTTGSINFWVDEYDAAGNNIAFTNLGTGPVGSTDANNVQVGDVNFKYTPAAGAVYARVYADIAPGTTGYIDNMDWLAPAGTSDTTPPTVPGTPAAPALTSSHQPSVSWTASTDSGSGLASPAYTLQWSQDATFATVAGQVTTDSTSASPNVDLADGTWYFRVLATDQAGYVATSVASNAVVIDSTAPVTSNVSGTATGSTSAVVAWTTNEPATSQVNYGTTNLYGGSTSPDTTLTTTHSVALAGLFANTTYHFQVISTDAAGNTPPTAEDYTFTTPSTPDTTKPVISGVATSGITSSSATISWVTDEPSSSQIGYGTDASYGSSSSLDSALTVNHSVSLAGLTAGTTYHYQVASTDAAGNVATSDDFTFTTATGSSSILGDLDHDGDVDEDDATVLFADWGDHGSNKNVPGDFDHNGVVDEDDATTLFANWSKV